jgi:hypothetical protein
MANPQLFECFSKVLALSKVNRIEQKSVKKNILFYVKKSMVFDDVRQNKQSFIYIIKSLFWLKGGVHRF